jgi:sulfotransferase family protein
VKIFCIGLNKTGTVSLHSALERFGFTSLHWGGEAAYLGVLQAIDERKPVLTYLDDADAYSDIETLSINFDLADAQYPGSRFILSVRDVDSWLDSRRRHVEKNVVRKARGEYTGSYLEVRLDDWRRQWVHHHRRVAEHFRHRDDLLVMNITAGDGWELLAPFLDRPIPLEPFPAENRYQPVTALAAAAT